MEKKVLRWEDVQKEAKLLHVTRFGRFTVAEAEAALEGKRYVGVGISRQGEGDRNKEEIGQNIAKSRAQKALLRKINGQRINMVLMG